MVPPTLNGSHRHRVPVCVGHAEHGGARVRDEQDAAVTVPRPAEEQRRVGQLPHASAFEVESLELTARRERDRLAVRRPEGERALSVPLSSWAHRNRSGTATTGGPCRCSQRTRPFSRRAKSRATTGRRSRWVAMSKCCSGRSAAGRRAVTLANAAMAATVASADSHMARSRHFPRAPGVVGSVVCAPAPVTQVSSRMTSPAFCHRSSGSLARHLVTM